MVKEAENAATYSEVEEVLKKLRVLKEELLPKKSEKRRVKHQSSGKPESESDMIRKCERIVSSRLRELRIRGKSPTGLAHPNRRVVRSESPPSTMKNAFLNSSHEEDSGVNVLNETLQALKNDMTKEKNAKERLKQRYERSREEIAQKDEEIEELKQQLQLQQSKVMERILQPQPPAVAYESAQSQSPGNLADESHSVLREK